MGSKRRSTWVLAFVAAFGALGGLSACGGSNDSNGNSNTNWLRGCQADSECGSLSCLCGVCTRACTGASSCEALSPSAICAPGSALGSACSTPNLCVSENSRSDGGGGDGGRTSTGGASGSGGAGGTKQGAGGRPSDAGARDAAVSGDASTSDASDAGAATCGQDEQICRCVSGAYCLAGFADCIGSTAPCPPDPLVPGCTPPCGAGTVCVRHQTVGGALIRPDAGVCEPPRVIVPEAPEMCSLPPTFSCEPAPSGCGATPTCACASSLCAASLCHDVIVGQIDCVEQVP